MAYHEKINRLFPVPPARRTRAEVAERTAHLSNWLRLHPELAALGPTQEDITTCALYIHLELERDGGPRPHILERVYNRYSNLRRIRETETLWAYASQEESAA